MKNTNLIELVNKSEVKNHEFLVEVTQSDVKQPTNLEKMSDKQILCKCKKYGTQTLLWRQKFIGLLPEVARRRLYEKKGFNSVFEFGKRMAGLSEAQIRVALNLERRFEDKPMLKSMLVDGKVSISKLARVVSVATVENDYVLAKSAEVLSKSSLDVLVKDVKRAQLGVGEVVDGFGRVGCAVELKSQNGLFEPKSEVKSLPGQRLKTNINILMNLNLSSEVVGKLSELKDKGMDVNEIILDLLEKREEEIVENKAMESAKTLAKEAKRRADGKGPTRRLTVGIKKVLKQEFGDKCGYAGCMREAKNIHHKLPFSVTGSNDPRLLMPLCREHHDIIHSVNLKYLDAKIMN